MRRPFAAAVVPVFALFVLPLARGQSKPDLPKAETVLTQFIEATGGKAAYEKVKTRVSTGTLEIAGLNVKGKVSVKQALPNKVAMVTDMGPAGKQVRVTDGKNAWDFMTLTGDRELEGDEKEAFLRDAHLQKELKWKDLYAKVECTGIEEVDGKPAYKIVLTPKSGKPRTEYYDKASHLLVRETITEPSPMGDVEVDTFPSDYKEVDGIKIPFTITQQALTQKVVIKLTEIKHNVDLPDDTFKRPAGADEPAKKK